MILYENILSKAKDFISNNKGKLLAAAALAGGAAYAHHQGWDQKAMEWAKENNPFNKQEMPKQPSDTQSAEHTATPKPVKPVSHNPSHDVAIAQDSKKLNLDASTTEPKNDTSTSTQDGGHLTRSEFKKLDDKMAEQQAAEQSAKPKPVPLEPKNNPAEQHNFQPDEKLALKNVNKPVDYDKNITQHPKPSNEYEEYYKHPKFVTGHIERSPNGVTTLPDGVMTKDGTIITNNGHVINDKTVPTAEDPLKKGIAELNKKIDNYNNPPKGHDTTETFQNQIVHDVKKKLGLIPNPFAIRHSYTYGTH